MSATDPDKSKNVLPILFSVFNKVWTEYYDLPFIVWKTLTTEQKE